MTDASAYNAIPRAIRSLYEPQLEQFGIIVRRNGEGWSGTGRSTWGRGSIWGMPVGDFCIAFSHEVYMEHDMALVESPESAYACVCMVSEDSKATMPRMIDRPRALLDGSLYSFVQPAGSFSGTLHRGGLYSSRCICFLPQYFEELDRRWPGAFSGMFERFGDTWDEAQSRIIMSALMGTGPQYRPGSALLIQARIEQMAAALEIPSEVLYKQFSTSYSAARGALNEFWRTTGMHRDWFADSFCQPVYEMFLAEAVALGRINAPGFFTDPLCGRHGAARAGSAPCRAALTPRRRRKPPSC